MKAKKRIMAPWTLERRDDRKKENRAWCKYGLQIFLAIYGKLSDNSVHFPIDSISTHLFVPAAITHRTIVSSVKGESA